MLSSWAVRFSSKEANSWSLEKERTLSYFELGPLSRLYTYHRLFPPAPEANPPMLPPKAPMPDPRPLATAAANGGAKPRGRELMGELLERETAEDVWTWSQILYHHCRKKHFAFKTNLVLPI